MEDYKIVHEYVPGLVSIIIPTHNRADLIRETIDSVFTQIYKNIELIIVNDHSTDDTFKIVNNIKEKSHLFDFKYLESEKNGGCAARNLGLINCRGEYIQFFDDDDIMLSNHISEKVHVLETSPKYDYVTCNFHYFEKKKDNIIGGKRMDNIEHTVESHLQNCSFPAPVFMCRRKCIETIGFWDEQILKYQDINYFHKLFLYEIEGLYLSEYLFKVRVHNDNITSNLSKAYYQSMFKSLDNVTEEWVKSNKANKKFVDVIYEMKVNIVILAYRSGYRLWSVFNFINMSLRNFNAFRSLLKSTISRHFYLFL